MTVDLQAVLGLLAQFIVIIGGIAAGFWGFKNWVKRTAVNPMMEQVGPNGNINQDTTRDIIEQIQTGQDAMIGRLDTHDDIGERNYQLAKEALETSGEALGVARHTSERLDRFLVERGGTL